jgi:hypothetical protein
LSSYIGRGFFGNFHPYYIWKFFNIESIGSTRFLQLVFILGNKILLLFIAKKMSLITSLNDEIKITYFLTLSLILLAFTGYGDSVFILRSFLLLLFIYILLKFLTENKKKSFNLFILGLFSGLSMLWYIDIGIYINVLSLILIIFFVYRREFKNIFLISVSIIISWLLIYLIFPNDEMGEFWKNNFLIISTLEYIHGLIFPTPFLSNDARSTRALLIFLLTGFMIIMLIRNLNKKNLIFIISIIFLYLVSIVFFKYGLSRSDSTHIRIAQSFVYIPFFSLVIYLILKVNFFNNLLNTSKKKYTLNLLLLVIFFTVSNLEKKHESKNFKNIFNFKHSVNKLIKSEDSNFLSKEYINLIVYYNKLIEKDKCVTIFTNETAIPYFLKKPTCSRYYLKYTASPKVIQKNMVQDIIDKKPSFIIYKSDLDIYHDKENQRLELVNKYITTNYKFFKKFKHWEIYARN